MLFTLQKEERITILMNTCNTCTNMFDQTPYTDIISLCS